MICSLCNRQHAGRDDDWTCAQRERRSVRRWAMLVMFAIFVVIVGVTALVNQWVHDDWRCMLVKCRKVTQ